MRGRQPRTGLARPDTLTTTHTHRGIGWFVSIVPSLPALRKESPRGVCVFFGLKMINPLKNRRFEGVWIPRDLWLSRDLTMMEKLMMVELRSLDSEDKGCYASNAYIAEFFSLSPNRVSEVINSLSKKGLISIEYERKGKQIISRSIRVLDLFGKSKGYSENTDGGIRKTEGGYSENTEVSSTSMNNTKTEVHITPHTPQGGLTLTSDSKAEPEKNKTEIAKEIFDYWKKVMESPRSVFSDDRKRKIIKALENYTPREICLAIKGCSVTPHNMGQNDAKTKYNDIALILRNSANIERFMNNAKIPPKQAPAQRQASTADECLAELDRQLGNVIGNPAYDDDGMTIEMEH